MFFHFSPQKINTKQATQIIILFFVQRLCSELCIGLSIYYLLVANNMQRWLVTIYHQSWFSGKKKIRMKQIQNRDDYSNNFCQSTELHWWKTLLYYVWTYDRFHLAKIHFILCYFDKLFLISFFVADKSKHQIAENWSTTLHSQ